MSMKYELSVCPCWLGLLNKTKMGRAREGEGGVGGEGSGGKKQAEWGVYEGQGERGLRKVKHTDAPWGRE